MRYQVQALVLTTVILSLHGCSSSGDGGNDGGVGTDPSCDPRPELWMSNCGNGCGPVMSCLSRCPSCSSSCQISCSSDFECASYGAGFCRAANCSTCARVCSQAPSTCRKEVDRKRECTTYTDEQTCECTVGVEGNDEACSEETLPGSVCCANKRWPGEGGHCYCRVPVVGCRVTNQWSWGEYCLCSERNVKPSERLDKCTGDVCCLEPEDNRCVCATGDVTSRCDDRETVASCLSDRSQLELTCNDDETPVASCSAP